MWLPLIGKHRRRRQFRRAFRLYWPDALMAGTAFAVAITAFVRWPDTALADIAFPAALLISFLVWRDR